MIRLRTALALLALSAPAAACSSGPSHGTVNGDLYVALASGEEVLLLGRRVHLLPDSAVVDSALARICGQRARELAARPNPADTTGRGAVLERAWQARERVLNGFSRRSTTTQGDNAVFVFDSVPAGEYRVWVDALVEEERWTWVEPIKLRGGGTAGVHLNNASADDDPFRCQKR